MKNKTELAIYNNIKGFLDDVVSAHGESWRDSFYILVTFGKGRISRGSLDDLGAIDGLMVVESDEVEHDKMSIDLKRFITVRASNEIHTDSNTIH